MKRKYVILNLIIAILLIFSGITAYAYFSTVKPFNHNVSYAVPEQYVQINTLDDFYREIDLYKDNQLTEFNSSSEVSTKRKTLILNADLELTNDAIITSDCHINLNGHTINLNGKKFNIKNTFAGTIAIFNTAAQKAVITDSVGTNNVVIDTPNACVVIDKIHIDTTIDVVTNAVSDEAVRESAIKLIYANISNEGVNNLYSTYSGLTTFLEPSRCILTAHATDSNTIGCVYTHSDLDLLDSFYNYDVAISYTSSNEGILKTSGKVIVGKTSDLVTLGVTVTYNGESTTKNINVHVVAEADYQKASNMALLAYLERYYNKEQGKYIFTNGFDLPLKNTYFNCNYDYKLMENQTEFLSSDPDYFIKDTAKNPEVITLKIKKNITNLVIESSSIANSSNKQVTNIAVIGETKSVIDDDYSYCLGIINGLYHNQITIKESKENNVIKYSSVALLKTTDPVKHSRLKEGSIIVNTLKSNSDNTYQITDLDADNQLLSVNPNSSVKPYIGQGVYMSFVFTMKDNKPIEIQLPVIFEPIKETGESGFQLFLPYFNFFDKKFDNNSKFEREYVQIEGHWYDSFSIPLFFNNEYPTYTFIIYERDKNNVNSFKMVDDALGLFKIQLTLPDGTVADMSSMTPSKLETFKNNTQARTRILIDPYKMNINTTEYFFAYVSIYSEIDNGNSLLKYHLTLPTATGLDDKVGISIEEIKGLPEAKNLDLNTLPYKSMLKLDGIVRTSSASHNAPEEFEDLEFYKFIFNKFYAGEVFEEGKTFIKTADLTRDLKPDAEATEDPNVKTRWETNNYSLNLSADNTLKITSLKGINHLKGITSLTLNRRNITTILGGNNNWIDQITYISGMTSLRILDLSNTGIYDRLGNNRKMPQGTSNNFITTLNALTNLEYLFLNNAPDVAEPLNQIYSFTGVQKFPKLKLLDVTGNNFKVPMETGTDILSQVRNIINRIFENIVNSLYGSNGSTNKPYFAVLKVRCEVINGEDIKLDENTKIIVSALSSLEYQNKIRTNEDISKVYAEYNYADLATKTKIFGLKSEYSEELKDGNGKNSVKLNYRLESIEFVPIDPNPSTDPNAPINPNLNQEANGFELRIKYTGGYQEWTNYILWYDWGAEQAFDPIEYTFYYEVERVS